MKLQFNHLLEGSVYCFVENLLAVKGEAYVSRSEVFKKTSGNFNGYTQYVSYGGPWLYDSGVGMPIPSGAYVNGNFTPNNTSGLKLDFQRGQVLISGSNNYTVSGSYHAREIPLYPTQESEEAVLFEKKNWINPRNLPNYVGREPNDKTVPCMFMKNKMGDNEFICFEGLAETEMTTRIILISDNSFIFNGVSSVIRDSKGLFFPLLNPAQLPFDPWGNVSGGWNYRQYQTNPDANRLFYVKSVRASEFDSRINSLIGQNCVAGFIDLNICSYRFSKQS